MEALDRRGIKVRGCGVEEDGAFQVLGVNSRA